MALDAVALYLLIPTVRYKLFLALWTGCLHVIFPLVGFHAGEWLKYMIFDWANTISAILLFFLGLQLLLSSKNSKIPKIPMPILAMAVSVDTFSVGLSFGMLNLQRDLFILSAGIGSFILSYYALVLSNKTRFTRSYIFKWVAGLILITMSVLSLI